MCIRASPPREPAERSTGAAASSSSEAEQSDEEAAPAEFDASVPLDESEREALRQRVGSALLCRDDALRCRVKGLEDADAALLARAIVSGGDAARLSAIDLSFNRLTDAGAAAAAAIVAAAPASRRSRRRRTRSATPAARRSRAPSSPPARATSPR